MNNDNYICKIKTECYRGIAIWKLQSDDANFPWHAYIDGENKDFDSLNEAKVVIDRFKDKKKSLTKTNKTSEKI